MLRLFFSLFMMFLGGCSQTNEDMKVDDPGDGAPVEQDDSSQQDTEEQEQEEEEQEEEEQERPDPNLPIPPPEGTDTTPEENDFDWNEVGSQRIGDSFPEQQLDWSAYPQYGTARVLDWSDNEACVCFDIDCITCSQDDCGPATCTYDFNASHTLTKYHVELQSTANTDHLITFEVNISAEPPITYTTIADVLSRLERIPVEYWYGLQIITEFGHGIQFFHGSYFSGASAYGSMNYIDTQTADLPILLHELGHTFEQYTRIGNPPIMEAQSNILNPIWRNAIRSDDNRTSFYGNNNEWEDMAEFARIYGLCLIEGSLPQLQTASPERYRIWERVLWKGETITQ